MESEKEWGIDIEGRKMWYEPWPVDDSGKYRKPTEKEIEKIYSISGEAIVETLVYFEECSGDTTSLISLLNEHVMNRKYIITRNELKDKKRWYNNEYYFYFIMFTKKIIGRYDFHFGENNDKLLSIYHRPFENGFLSYIPWGKGNDGKLVKEQGGNYILGGYYLTRSMLKSDQKDDFDTELILFLTRILPKKYNQNLTIDYFKKEFNWYSFEFLFFFYSILLIFSNKNDLIERSASHVLNEQVAPISTFLVKRASFLSPDAFLKNVTTTANKITVPKLIQSNKNSYSFQISYTKEFIEKYKDYTFLLFCIYNYEIAYAGAFRTVPKFIYNLKHEAFVKVIKSNIDINGIHAFLVRWKPNKIKIFPYIFFLLWSIFFLLFFLLTKMSVFIILFFLFANLYQLYLIYKKNKNNLRREDFEDFQRSRYDLEIITEELINERDKLEETVRERTNELQNAYEKLKELDKTKTNFFTNISHELRTPLTLIKSPLEAIIRGKYGNSLNINHELLKTIHSNATKLLFLIEDLLDYSRIESGKISLKKENIDIKYMLEIIIAEFDSIAKSKEINLSLKCKKTESIEVSIDQRLFERAICNLISNAIKFTEKGGKIILEIDVNEYTCFISVIDTGIGIPEDKIDLIFERFRQLEEGTNRKFEGAGIGLSFVKEIVKLHKGNITVKSIKQEGSVFTIQIPISQNNAKSKSIKPKENNDQLTVSSRPIASSQNYNILIVEDNEQMLDYLKSLLYKNNYIITAQNGKEGLRKLKSDQPIDLIITDIMMPVMDGIEFYHQIRENENYLSIPVIILTAKATHEEKIKGLKAGVIDYIYKPFSPDELVSKVNSVLDFQKKSLQSSLRKIEKIANHLYNREQGKNEPDRDFNIECEQYKITEREKDIIRLVCEGLQDKEIASELNIKKRTVSTMLLTLYQKVKVTNRTELSRIFFKYF